MAFSWEAFELLEHFSAIQLYWSVGAVFFSSYTQYKSNNIFIASCWQGLGKFY